MAGIWPPFSEHMSHFILIAFFYLREVQNIWSCLSPPTQTTRYCRQQTEFFWQKYEQRKERLQLEVNDGRELRLIEEQKEKLQRV